MTHLAAPGTTAPAITGYTWVRALGSGGFADVHLYHQLLPSRDVAIKIVRSPGDQAGVEELRREADALAAVGGHPAVVELHGVGVTDDARPYLVMEYCPVADIGDQVRSRPLAVDQALDMMVQVCGGVEVLHRCGLVHRDIKPGNLMLDAYGRPVLGDFGVAARVGALESGLVDGFSVLWAPPEQQDAQAHAHPTQDVWALAATTWTLLSGRSPFEDPLGDNRPVEVARRVRSGRIRALGRQDAPGLLETVLREAMDLDPLRRTASAVALGEGLQEVQRLMGRPVTPMQLGGGVGAAGAAVLGGGPGAGASGAGEGTRLHAVAAVDADRTRLRTPNFDFQDQAVVPQQDSWSEEPQAQATGPRPQSVPEPGRRLPLRGLVLAVVTAVMAAGVGVAMLTGGGRSVHLAPAGTPADYSDGPQEAVDVLPLPVTGLTGQVEGSEVVWTWTDGVKASSAATAGKPGQSGQSGAHPEARYFVYTATRPGQTDLTERAEKNLARVPAVPGENCVEVQAVAASGRLSPVVRQCVQVP